MSLDPSADPLPADPLPADPLPADAGNAAGPRRARSDAERFPRDPQVPGSASGAVVWVAVALIVALLVAAGFWPAQMSSAAGAAMHWVTTTGGWSLLLIPLCLIALLLVLACTRFGDIRLGPDDSRPEYPTFAWIAMLLGAVMGIGMVTYGVAEPVSHLVSPPHGLAEPGSQEAVVDALRFTFLDWGLHAWAVFATFGLAIGYSTHRLGNKGLVSPILRPLIGRHADGPVGKAIDVLVILSTLFGTTTSLGLGAAQISQGMSRITGLDLTTTNVQLLIIALVTVLFTASAMSGIGRGIRYLSQTTMVVAAALLLFVLATGPTSWLINLFLRSLGGYAGGFVEISLMLPTDGADVEWMQAWTYFMMAWWISWGAFVGIFLARISRGRTIRQFVLVVLGVPSLIFSAWFTVFGGSAMFMDLERDAGIGDAATENVNTAFFALLDQLPLSGLTSVVAVVLVIMYFVTSADSNTYVLAVISSDGRLNPSRPLMGMWGVLTGATAAVLLYAGGLEALQTAVMLSAAPFIFVILALAVSLVMMLRRDPLIRTGATSRRSVARSDRADGGAQSDRNALSDKNALSEKVTPSDEGAPPAENAPSDA